MATNNKKKDVALTSCMVWLAAVMVVIGIWTQSLKKVMVTYAVGMIGIGGVLLPDWEFFDRDFSRWWFPITEEERAALALTRKRISPFRLVVYSAVYGYGLHKWWTFIST